MRKIFLEDFHDEWLKSVPQKCKTMKYQKEKSLYKINCWQEIIKKMDETPTDEIANQKYLLDYLHSHSTNVSRISVEEKPKWGFWYNTTEEGINLRPGFLENSNIVPDPIILKGQDTHGIVVGRTGSGKSVFLNTLLLNMMVEYAPWELELYLADFKKVELSQYMTSYPAVHVKACAATSEVEYVKSLLNYIKEQNNEREKLFQRVGMRNITEFREKFPDIVMPRILFLVDEFQQLFLDTTAMQKAEIQDMLTVIIRKGRSQGIHLLLASQDMQGALNRNQLTNFNVRFALPCDSSVSSDVLDDLSATKLSTGQVIARSSKNRENYLIPIAESPGDDGYNDNNPEETWFKSLLKDLQIIAKKYNYEYLETQKFYQEDEQKDLTELEQLLFKNQIKQVRCLSKLPMEMARGTIASLVLGRMTIYSTEAYDIENIYIENSVNRSLLCVSSNNSDLAYMQKLIGLNLRTMAENNDAIENPYLSFDNPMFFDFNPNVASFYTMDERINDFRMGEYGFLDFFTRQEDLSILYEAMDYRTLISEYLQNPDYTNAKSMCLNWYEERCKKEFNTTIDSDYEKVYKWLDTLQDDDSNILDSMDDNILNEIMIGDNFQDILKFYYRYRICHIHPISKLFHPTPIFITGIETMDKIPSQLEKIAIHGTKYNFLMIFLSNAAPQIKIKNASNYIFVSGTDPSLYENSIGIKPPQGDNENKIRCYIRNSNQKFAFKKYRCKLNEVAARRINFDSILNINV